MKLVFILGSLAVGKMTVGQELTKITSLQLLHNHIMFELVAEHFGKDFACGCVTDKLKDVIYEEYSKSNNYGLIVTLAINFDAQSDWDELNRIANIFKKANAQVYYVELVAPQEIRLQRNKTENRLPHKASIRNISASDKHLVEIDKKCRFESNDGEFLNENHIKIDNSTLSPDIVAKMIKENFSL